MSFVLGTDYGNPKNFVYIPDDKSVEFLQELKKQVLLKISNYWTLIDESAIPDQFKSKEQPESALWAHPLKWDNNENYQPSVRGNYQTSIDMSDDQKQYFEKLLKINYSDDVINMNQRMRFLCQGTYKIIPDGYETKYKQNQSNSLKVANPNRSEVNLPWIKVEEMILPVNPFVGGGIESELTDMSELVNKILSDTTYQKTKFSYELTPHNNGLGRVLGHFGPNFAVDAVITSGNGINTQVIALYSAERGGHMIGGMMETAAGFFAMIKELIEEGRIFPDDLQIDGDDDSKKLLTRKFICTKEYLNAENVDQYLKDRIEQGKEEGLSETEAIYKAIVDPNSIINLLGDKRISHKFNNELRGGKYTLLTQSINQSFPGIKENDVEKTVHLALKYPMNHLSFPMTIMESDRRNSCFCFMVSHGLGLQLNPVQYQNLKEKKLMETEEGSDLIAFFLKDVKGLQDKVPNQFKKDKSGVKLWETHYNAFKLFQKELGISFPSIQDIKGELHDRGLTNSQAGGKPKRKTHKNKSNRKRPTKHKKQHAGKPKKQSHKGRKKRQSMKQAKKQ